VAVNRRLRTASGSLLISAAALAVLVALNVLASRGAQAWDLTRSGINTLAPQSVLAAKSLDSNLLVIGLFKAGDGSDQAQAEALVALYEAQTPRISYKSENFDVDVADVRKYSVREPDTLVLDYGGKTQLLTPTLQTEQDFTAALLKLQARHTPVVCWAAGAGGRSRSDTSQTGYSSIADILERNNFQTKDVLIADVGAIPSDCDELVLIAPSVPLSQSSVRAIGAYVAAGGSLLIAGEPWAETPAATASLNGVMEPYGLGFSGALVVETDASRAYDVITPAVLVYGRSPITRDIQGVASFFPQTTAIAGTASSSATAVVIGATTGSSYAISTPRQDLARQAGDEPGPFVMMETLEVPGGAKNARIVMVGTTGFAENRVLPPSSNDANLELALGSFQWLAREDALISLPPKPARALPLTLTRQDQSTVIFVTIFLMPGLIVFAGVMVWWRRRLFR
jgi:gliding motility-associatede transport system auxiliary component